MSAGRRVNGVLPIMQVEASAVMFGLKLAYDCGFRNI